MSEQDNETGNDLGMGDKPEAPKGRGRPKLTEEKLDILRQETREKLWTPGLKKLSVLEGKDVWLPNPPSGSKKGTTVYKAYVMECFLELLRHGHTFSSAAEYMGYDYDWWSKTSVRHPDWAAECRAARSGEVQKFEYPDLSHMSFPEFVREYFGFDLAAHQLQMSEALADPMARLVLILGFPEAGKSTLVSLWYALYRLAQNPNRRLALVAKAGAKAQDLLTRCKRYLTEEHLYDDTPRSLIADFNGWKPTHGDFEWSQDQIFVRHRTSGERDPSIQALGIGKQIYGTRLDLLILDDALVLDNQITELQRDRLDIWFTNEARSRAQRGQTVVNGTRLFPPDLYGQWKKSWEHNPLFRGVYIPAILDEWTDNEKISWPEYWTLDGYDKEEIPETGIMVYQPGMRDIRTEIMARDPARWKLVYQQEDVQDQEAIFRQSHIDAARELGKHRSIGQVFDHEILILGVDPATTGRAASVLIALDPESRVRTVVDIYVGSRLGGAGVRRSLLYQFWDRYADHPINFTIVEVNFAPTLLADETLRQKALVTGTTLRSHHTTARGQKRGSKWDEEYGIGGLQTLFSGNLVAFPSKEQEDVSKLQPLVDDMLGFPWVEQQDALVAFWVAEGEARIAHIVAVDQGEFMGRRGVPPIISQRAKIGEENGTTIWTE